MRGLGLSLGDQDLSLRDLGLSLRGLGLSMLGFGFGLLDFSLKHGKARLRFIIVTGCETLQCQAALHFKGSIKKPCLHFYAGLLRNNRAVRAYAGEYVNEVNPAGCLQPGILLKP